MREAKYYCLTELAQLLPPPVAALPPIIVKWPTNAEAQAALLLQYGVTRTLDQAHIYCRQDPVLMKKWFLEQFAERNVKLV